MANGNEENETFPQNFIHDIIDEDLATGRRDEVVTRFPPEPNGYLHIGHATAIVLNFETARKYDGRCHLRFDDTNPLSEESEYVEAIQNDVRWLGYDWGEHLYFASDYFEFMYDCAVRLIKKGLAYVDSSDIETIREYRGTVTEPGKESPYRERSVEENLDLFERMRAGEFEDGEHVLRAKIDMSASNMLMRDPLLYRIRHATHHNTGDEWCIYPMYDFAHCLEDSHEGITHSLCTLEFENNREIYDWLIRETEVEHQPQQIEFARRNLGYTVTSKRKLLKLINEDVVGGWDDPRLPTIAGLRRRGVPPSAIRTFCKRIGVSKNENRVQYSQFEDAVRHDLNMKAPRVMAVVDPLKVVITNYDEDKVEWLDASYYPHDVPLEGSRKVPFSRELFVERDDFHEDPPADWYRLAPGKEVRLRYGYYVTCQEVVRGDDGEIKELRCTYDPETKGGDSPDGREVKGTLHWVSATEGIPCEIRLYERLFEVENPDGQEDKSFEEFINEESLVKRADAVVEPSVADDESQVRYQFERQGYFWRDPVDSTDDALVFNRIVSLRDSWSQKQKEKKRLEDEARRKEKERLRQKAIKAQQEAGGDAISEEREAARRENPQLAEKFEAYVGELGLNEVDADVLTGDEELAAYFEAVLAAYDAPRSVAPWLVNEVLPRLDEGQSVGELGLAAEHVAALVEMVEEDRITTQVSRDVLEEVLKSGRAPETVVTEEGLEKVSDEGALGAMVDQVIADHPDEVERYRGGNKRLVGFFIGQIMKATGGAADAVKVRELLSARLDE